MKNATDQLADDLMARQLEERGYGPFHGTYPPEPTCVVCDGDLGDWEPGDPQLCKTCIDDGETWPVQWTRKETSDGNDQDQGPRP